MYTKGFVALAAYLVAATASPIRRAESGVKKGICYNDVSSLSKYGDSVTWVYNWGGAPDGGYSSLGGKEFVPILHPEGADRWDSDVKKALNNKVTHLLGPNEPDQPKGKGGTDMSVSTVQPYYVGDGKMAKYSGKAKIGAPGISSGGIDWLRDFHAACNGQCKIDFVPLHFYDYDHPDPEVQVESMKGWLKTTIDQVKEWFGEDVEIWITEFGYKGPGGDVIGNQANNEKYIKAALPWLESKESRVNRFAYFKSEFLTTAVQTYIGA